MFKMEQAHILLDEESDDDEWEDLDQLYEEGRRFTYFYLICKRGTKQCRKGADKISSNAYYIFLITIGSLLALTCRVVGAVSDDVFPVVNSKACDNAWCRGNEAVYRVSCGLVEFFALLLVVEPLRVSIRECYFAVKFALLSILIAINFVIPNDFYVPFVGLARVFSYFFLLFQGVVILEASYV